MVDLFVMDLLLMDLPHIDLFAQTCPLNGILHWTSYSIGPLDWQALLLFGLPVARYRVSRASQ